MIIFKKTPVSISSSIPFFFDNEEEQLFVQTVTGRLTSNSAIGNYGSQLNKESLCKTSMIYNLDQISESDKDRILQLNMQVNSLIRDLEYF